jgi:hypothetical protein
MNVYALFLAVGTLCFAVAWLLAERRMRQLIREHARERQLLINQILNLSGHPWLPAPAEEQPLDEEEVSYTTSGGWNPDE